MKSIDHEKNSKDHFLIVPNLKCENRLIIEGYIIRFVYL